jgi:sialate O-acetylesterase
VKKNILFGFLIVISSQFYVGFSQSNSGSLRLPAIISDHMVLQGELDIPVWGWTDPGEIVTVKIEGQKLTAQANDRGEWKVEIPELEAGGPYKMTVTARGQSIKIKDILVGEAWICSGQSNMQWSLAASENGDEEITNADYPEIRLFTVAMVTAVEPQDDCNGEWVVCSPETAGTFSGVGYFFGREIHKELNLPIGLINSSWGGTPAEAWTSKQTIDENPDYYTLEKRYIRTKNRYDIDRNEFDSRLEKSQETDFISGSMKASLESLTGVWDILSGAEGQEIQSTVTISLNKGELEVDMAWPGPKSRDIRFEEGVLKWSFTIPVYYSDPFDVRVNIDGDILSGTISSNANGNSPFRGVKRTDQEGIDPQLTFSGQQNRPASLYNAMIAPLAQYAIRGAIWYQGEANTSRAYTYRSLFPDMIRDWRRLWDQGDFPFLFVQIAPFDYGSPKVAAELREAQMMTLSLENTGMVVTTDIATIDDIHPTNKLDVGKRLALWALAKNYGRDELVFSGPLYRSMQVEGDKIRLHFDHVGGGLLVRDGELTDFTIAGKDRKFVEAKARIERNTIIVWSGRLAKPVAVRFGWTNTAEPNLFNKEGLPASTFRTDDWPGVTQGNQEEEVEGSISAWK